MKDTVLKNSYLCLSVCVFLASCGGSSNQADLLEGNNIDTETTPQISIDDDISTSIPSDLTGEVANDDFIVSIPISAPIPSVCVFLASCGGSSNQADLSEGNNIDTETTPQISIDDDISTSIPSDLTGEVTNDDFIVSIPISAPIPGEDNTVALTPMSYPASDADKYSIPKAQRRAGSLGGPPPPPVSN